MYMSKSVAVVVPCYNEETQIIQVLATMPSLVDLVIVVDDFSSDGTVGAVCDFMQTRDPAGRVELIAETTNQGVGRAISKGYQEALRRGIDVVAVMAGDGQMDPDELTLLIEPVATGRADYAKGNRLFYSNAWEHIPKHRYLGNAFLSMLTKVASGYWHSADSQTGYTAISNEALQLIDVDELYPRYGYPNDMLVRLNLYDMRVTDVPIRPVYNIGEQSKMKLSRVIPTMSWLIFKRFLWRLKTKYIMHDFHPLVMFYAFGAVSFIVGTLFGLWLLMHRILTGPVTGTSCLMSAMLFMSGLQLLLFAMWFDMENNRELRVISRPKLKHEPRDRPAARHNGHPPVPPPKLTSDEYEVLSRN